MKISRLLFAVLLTVSTGLGAFAQSQINAIDKYFKQYVDDENFTVVYISPKLFEMFREVDTAKLQLDDEEAEAIIEMAQELQGLRILQTEVNGRKYYDEARARINTSEYETLLTVRSKEENDVEVLALTEGTTIQELLVLSGGEDEFVLISFVGNITMERATKLARSFE